MGELNAKETSECHHFLLESFSVNLSVRAAVLVDGAVERVLAADVLGVVAAAALADQAVVVAVALRNEILMANKNETKSVFAHLLQVQQEPDAYPVRAGRLRHGAPVAVRAAHPVGLGAAAAGALDVAAVALPFFMFGRIRGECTICSTIALLSRWCC